MKSIKLNEFIRIVKPKYKYLKLTPNNSIRNQSTYKIARTIASLYKNVFQRIRKEECKVVKILGKEFLMGTKYEFDTFDKFGYFVYIEKKKIEFYFIIPEKHASIITEKINDVWAGITISEVDELPTFDKTATSHSLSYEKEDALSLSTDRRNNDLLRSNLNIVNVLNENDKVGIYYNFIPTLQHSWKHEHKATMIKLNNNVPIDRNKGKLSYMLKYSLKLITNLIDGLLSAFVDKNKRMSEEGLNGLIGALNKKEQVGAATLKKEHAIIVDTQIVITSQSDKKVNQLNNIKSLSQSFESISDDNRLISKKINKKINLKSRKFIGVPTIKTSDVECQNFISLAGRDLLEEYNFMDKVETKETQVPDELKEGKMNIGANTFRGHKQEAFLSNDDEYKNLTLMLIGPTRAGKSTLIENLSNDALKNGECVIMFDFIKNCELSEDVSRVIPKDKILNIECNDFKNIQGLGYNEVGKELDPFKQYDNAKKQTTQLMALINSINSDDVSLTAKMERYLTSASLVVFISNGSIKDVFDVLQNHDKRRRFIDMVPEQQEENMEEYIFGLRGLDDVDKEGLIIGTKLNLIVGIIDRLNKLKANTYMELMLKKDTKNNFDLSEEIQKNQLICLKMPEDMFSTDHERDVYTTYWISKVWLALQMRARNIKDRKDHTKVNLIIDELYQVNNTEKFLTEKLSRLAKFSVKPIISCHYINQLKFIRNELRSANASYMMISGCDKNNYSEFKEELYPYEMEDLLKLKRYHSLNIIKCKDGYAKFITKLPKPIRK